MASARKVYRNVRKYAELTGVEEGQRVHLKPGAFQGVLTHRPDRVWKVVNLMYRGDLTLGMLGGNIDKVQIFHPEGRNKCSSVFVDIM